MVDFLGQPINLISKQKKNLFKYKKDEQKE